MKRKRKTKQVKDQPVMTAPPTFKEQFLARATEQLEAFLASDRHLTFPFFYNPEISIVIVTYKQTPLELLCLMSILRWDKDLSYEVILSNNGTSEQNKALMDKLKNVKVINHGENVGFVKGVNLGIKEAAGKYVLLLNDDALVTYECIQSLVRMIRGWRTTKVGIVGAQVRTLDNVIQDAGGILFNNGVAAEYSKGRNPEIGDVNFTREVDYVSGACFMTPKELFDELGGFDEAFSPGYCEESDYCLRARKAGYKTIYEPEARVMHYEYGSSDKSQVSDLVKEHTKLLYNKHTDIWHKHYHPSTPTIFARSAKRYRGHVLIVDDLVPRPKHGDSEIIDFVKALVSKNYFVTFFPRFSSTDDWLSVHDWLPSTVEVMLYEDLSQLSAILSERPRFYDYFISKTFDFSNIVMDTHAADGKYVIHLTEEEDWNCDRLKELLKPTALWVDWHIPEYDTNAGDYAVRSYCSALKELGYKIRFWSDDPNWVKQDPKYREQLVKEAWEIWNTGWTFEQTVADLGHTVDLVILSRPEAINYIDHVRNWTTAPVIWYCHHLQHLFNKRMLEQGHTEGVDPAWLAAIQNHEQVKEVEYKIIDKSDLFVTVSQFERDEVIANRPEANVSVWPWYCAPKHLRARRQEPARHITFLGGLQHSPNFDAIKWFLDEIYPLVREGFERPRFNIIGSYIPKEIQDLHDNDYIYVRGFIEDLGPHFIGDTVFVAPMRYGAGLKGKIAMAMSYGVPVVTTSIGSEGMGLVHEENVLIADTTEDFAKQVLRLMHDKDLWQKIADGAYSFAENNWSLKAVAEHLKKDISKLGARRW